MKILKNGNIAFYRPNRRVIFGAGVMGWIMGFAVLYFVIDPNKQVFCIVASILFFMMIAQFLFMMKFILPPVLVVSPRGMELNKGKHVLLFWNQITAVYRREGVNSMEQLVFETAEGPVHTIPLVLFDKDRKYLFELLQEHNLSVQEHPL